MEIGTIPKVQGTIVPNKAKEVLNPNKGDLKCKISIFLTITCKQYLNLGAKLKATRNRKEDPSQLI